jgi:molybdate transport system substrate-binding protein
MPASDAARAAALMAAAIALGAPAAAQTAAPGPAATELVVYAAGSLRRALTTVAADFERAAPGVKVRLVFGASGLLLERIRDKGERADVFASANMEHPQALATGGRAQAVQAFARNALCALHPASFDLSTANLVDRLLDPAVRLGTSTPRADPSGDYAFAMFDRIDQQPGRAGAGRALAAKALQLTGGPNSPPPPPDRNVYGVLVASGQADVFITYCTNATVAMAEQPTLRMLRIPESINVGASYGVATLRDAPPQAGAFVAHLLGPAGQAVLAREGFAAP